MLLTNYIKRPNKYYTIKQKRGSGNMQKLEFNELFEELLQEGLFTEEELILACNLCGSTTETLNNCIYARFGYRDYNQFLDDLKCDL